MRLQRWDLGAGGAWPFRGCSAFTAKVYEEMMLATLLLIIAFIRAFLFVLLLQ